MGFLKEQWTQTRGNIKWDLLKLAGAAMLTGLYALIARIRHVPADVLGYTILFLASFLAFVWLTRKTGEVQRASSKTQAAVGAPAATLAMPSSPFDPKQFFAQSYNSTLAEEVAGNIRTVASNYQLGQERDDFFVKFITTGLVGYLYDTLWWGIFKSQLLLLQELNRKALSVQEVRNFYDKAAQQYPAEYATYSFEQWLAWMHSQLLIIQQGNMVGITVRGRDFLKFLVHWSRSAEDRRC
ncbi:MAG: hypothetical protein ACHP7P_04890 [Terriglobales bacterium]